MRARATDDVMSAPGPDLTQIQRGRVAARRSRHARV